MIISDIGPVIILFFLLITYLLSAYEKINDWTPQLNYYKELYKSTFLNGVITPTIYLVLTLEIIVSTLTALGIWDILFNSSLVFSIYALASSSIICAILLFGLRMVKDYAGSARIAIYFLVSIFGLYWVQSLIPMN